MIEKDALSRHYRTLELHRSASPKEIRAAYYRLARVHHPDHNYGDPEAEERFKKIQTAFEALSKQRAARPPRQASPFPFETPCPSRMSLVRQWLAVGAVGGILAALVWGTDAIGDLTPRKSGSQRVAVQRDLTPAEYVPVGNVPAGEMTKPVSPKFSTPPIIVSSPATEKVDASTSSQTADLNGVVNEESVAAETNYQILSAELFKNPETPLRELLGEYSSAQLAEFNSTGAGGDGYESSMVYPAALQVSESDAQPQGEANLLRSGPELATNHAYDYPRRGSSPALDLPPAGFFRERYPETQRDYQAASIYRRTEKFGPVTADLRRTSFPERSANLIPSSESRRDATSLSESLKKPTSGTVKSHSSTDFPTRSTAGRVHESTALVPGYSSHEIKIKRTPWDSSLLPKDRFRREGKWRNSSPDWPNDDDALTSQHSASGDRVPHRSSIYPSLTSQSRFGEVANGHSGELYPKRTLARPQSTSDEEPAQWEGSFSSPTQERWSTVRVTPVRYDSHGWTPRSAEIKSRKGLPPLESSRGYPRGHRESILQNGILAAPNYASPSADSWQTLAPRR